ncbi:hypothetical protein ONZ45_g17275 [Pleurotus djamor]|nr:hypothetical protein ONZ45_g17275 [Pleurotus djamor]
MSHTSNIPSLIDTAQPIVIGRSSTQLTVAPWIDLRIPPIQAIGSVYSLLAAHLTCTPTTFDVRSTSLTLSDQPHGLVRIPLPLEGSSVILLVQNGRSVQGLDWFLWRLQMCAICVAVVQTTALRLPKPGDQPASVTTDFGSVTREDVTATSWDVPPLKHHAIILMYVTEFPNAEAGYQHLLALVVYSGLMPAILFPFHRCYRWWLLFI